MDHESLVYHHFQYLEWLFDYGWVHPCMIQPAKKDITMETPQILKKNAQRHDHMHQGVEQQTTPLQGLLRFAPESCHRYHGRVMIDLQLEVRNTTFLQQHQHSVQHLVVPVHQKHFRETVI